MISRSNKVSRFVASSIVWVSNKQGRASMYAKWIQVAEKLRKLNNFNTLMGVVSAHTHNAAFVDVSRRPVGGLEHEFGQSFDAHHRFVVRQASRSERSAAGATSNAALVFELVSPCVQASVSRNQSFKVYRETLQKASGPAVPFLGVYLTDLTFTEDGWLAG